MARSINIVASCREVPGTSPGMTSVGVARTPSRVGARRAWPLRPAWWPTVGRPSPPGRGRRARGLAPMQEEGASAEGALSCGRSPGQAREDGSGMLPLFRHRRPCGEDLHQERAPSEMAPSTDTVRTRHEVPGTGPGMTARGCFPYSVILALVA